MASMPRSQRVGRRQARVATADGVSGDFGIPESSTPAADSRRKAARRRQRPAAVAHPKGFAGFPSLDGLKPVLLFFCAPLLLALGAILNGGSLPASILYPAALLMGAYVAYSTLNGLELVIACLLLYLPFSTTHSIGLAPAVNGTNMLVLLGLGGALFQAYKGRGWFVWLPGTLLVYLFGFLSALSGFTTLSLPNGYSHLVYNELINYKGWLEQFLLFFILQCGIRDREAAKRLIIYMAIGTIVLILYVVPEMLEKAGRSTIESSRLEGPHRQSNNFGGFVAYSLMAPLAIFIVYMRNSSIWLTVPFFLLALKILITTFSRGAYLAIALGGFCAGYFRGKGFLVFWASLGLVFLMLFPQFVPESIMARMQTVTNSASNHNTTVSPDQLDTSSRERLVLWRASARIAIENPITGLGFKSFPVVKDRYTDEQLSHVSDPHNMYLSIAAEMGLPTLSLFLLILYYSYRMGSQLSREKSDHFLRAIGIGGVAATVCYAVICIFGSRAVNLEFSCFFWALFVVMQVSLADPEVLDGQRKRQKVRNFPLTTRRSRARAKKQAEADAQKAARKAARKAAQASQKSSRTQRTNAFIEQSRSHSQRSG